jgi:3-methylcrotonyl-CoA carboxylase alpha subunit
MLRKLLIANRGEIACRIARTARRLGVATVAVYSDADARALHVAAADEALHIGGSPSTESYLAGERIIAAAKKTGAEAIHPGYGFLAENAEFAAAVAEAGLTFVGPSAAAMRALGGKAAAKQIAIDAGVPVVPGYQGAKQDARSLATEARRIGFPVMIKAVAGGGGRGMRLVESEADLAGHLASARREASSAFGDDQMLIERLVVRPRHVEVQVFGDRHGNVVHLFERDCSLQRRNQKVIEEAPAPGMAAALREKICGAAVTLARAVGYEGAGTVEFLIEGGSLGADARWYFIEMNTRLQVEHPVTEEITGLDLVEWQLRVAAGEPLPLLQSQIAMRGHAIEARLCAEDPANGFMPSVGRLSAFAAPGGIDGLRVETGVGQGSEVSPYYDSMIAKLIATGADRAEAMARLRRALERMLVAGPRTNGAVLHALLSHADVAAGRMDTGLIGRDLALLAAARPSAAGLAAGVRVLLGCGGAPDCSPWGRQDAFQLGGTRTMTRPLDVEGKPASVALRWPAGGGEPQVAISGIDCADGPGPLTTVADGSRVHVIDAMTQWTLAWPVQDLAEVSNGEPADSVRAPINGRLAKLMVEAGARIEKGDRVAVVEAMKMEHIVQAGRAGVVTRVAAAEGAQVTQGALIATIGEA